MNDTNRKGRRVTPDYEVLEKLGFGWFQMKHILIVGVIICCDAAQVSTFNSKYNYR